MSEHEQLIRGMLAKYKPGEIVGYARKQHGVVLTQDEIKAVCVKVYAETGKKLQWRTPSPVPVDFAEHAHEQNAALMERYKTGVATVIRWRNETGLAGASPLFSAGNDAWKLARGSAREALPAPDDLAKQARLMTRRKLAEHYGRSVETIDRWLKRINVRAKHSSPVAPTWTNNLGSMTKQFDARENSEAGRAAKWMQQFWPTFRCDVRGEPMPDGFFWNCGGKVMTDDEIIAAADEKRERDARLLRARAA